jgi:hypothetical protein
VSNNATDLIGTPIAINIAHAAGAPRRDLSLQSYSARI